MFIYFNTLIFRDLDLELTDIIQLGMIVCRQNVSLSRYFFAVSQQERGIVEVF